MNIWLTWGFSCTGSSSSLGSDKLIQCVNDCLVQCCSAKQFRALACHKLSPESRKDSNGKEGNPGVLNAPVLLCAQGQVKSGQHVLCVRKQL